MNKYMETCNQYLSFNSCGLREGIEYQFNEDKTVDWSKLIDSQYLVPNRSIFEKRNQPVPDSIEGLRDNEKLLRLAGYRKLAFLRGFTSVKYTPIGSSDEEITVSCEIIWRGNFETSMESITYSSIGNASIRNTDEFFSKFLGPLAENRAFIRNTRMFLNIPILGQEELAPEDKKKESDVILPNNVSPTSPHAVLINKMRNASADFEKAKKYWIKCGLDANLVNSWKDIISIPNKDVITILGFSNKK